MKKVIGIFLAMVMVFVFVSMAFAEDGISYGKYDHEVCDMVHDWADNQGYWDWTMDKPRCLNGVGYACGALNKDAWENETGYEWSIDNFKKWLDEEWETCEVHIRVIGTIDGVNVYLCETQSETKIAGSAYNYEKEEYEDCYCASIMFAVCTEKDM